MMSDTETVFPFETRVILHGLLNAPELNGKLGIVRSELNSAGRYSVFIKDENKTVGLKPLNLQYEPRTVGSLSAKELKMVLKGKQVEESEYSGIDKSELRAKVLELVPDEEDIPKLLAKGMAAAPKPPPPAAKKAPARHTQTQNQGAQAAEQLSKMSPDQLRQQAQMMRSMPPSTIRSMNPQFAQMTDAQIAQVADQLEMMANNPQLMEMATNQMKNMDPAELERMQAQARSGTMPMGPGGPAGRQLDLATQMASSDQDPAKLLQSMDKNQLKTMMKTVKDNPEMLKQYAVMAGTSEEQLKQGLEAFSGMSDDKLEAALKMMQTAAVAKEKWTKVNEKTGGHLAKILVAWTVLFFGLIVWYFFFRTSSTTGATLTPNNVVGDIPNIAKDTVVEEEFESEF
jgi:hypothetical protein